jgi:PhnB protein
MGPGGRHALDAFTRPCPRNAYGRDAHGATMGTVNPIPDNYPRLSPYLILDGAADAIAFYKDVLGAKQRGDVMQGPNGKVGHAELAIGDSVVMLADKDPMQDHKTGVDLGGSPVVLCVYVEDVDAVVAKAKEKGANVVRDVEDQFYGDRSGGFIDPWGQAWNIMTHVEDVSPEEMERRARQQMQSATA